MKNDSSLRTGDAARPAQHTPGPWIAAAGPSSVVGWPVVSREGRSICRLTWLETNSPTEEVFKEETRANARLIAAAPDLLAQLKSVTLLLRTALLCTTVEIAHEAKPFLAAADAAIANATKGAAPARELKSPG